VPEGFSRVVAIDQLIEFGSMCADVAARYGITIAVEPLNTRECNILNTVDECGQYVARVAHPNLMLLVDAYHWSVNDNDTESLERYAAFLTHVHVATYSSRLPPGAEPCDFDGFFGALKESGYRGAVTVEAHWDNFDAQALAAVDTLRRYAE
jgi:sugar phosphate isomerase/epimerase